VVSLLLNINAGIMPIIEPKDEDSEFIVRISDVRPPDQLTIEFVEEGAKEAHQKILKSPTHPITAVIQTIISKPQAIASVKEGSWELLRC
jgi:hypothetical protein